MKKPKNVKQAVDELLPRFEGMYDIFNKTEDDFAAFCHSQWSGGIGMRIRNDFGFWSQDSKLYKHLVKKYNLSHPDDMSDFILRMVYRKYNKIRKEYVTTN
jgi:hypothetical protein